MIQISAACARGMEVNGTRRSIAYSSDLPNQFWFQSKFDIILFLFNPVFLE